MAEKWVQFFLLFYAFDQFDHNEKMGESKMQFCR